VVFWMATMSWLLVDKLWPTLRIGNPPNYHSILRAQESETANAWAIYWNERLAGWSVGRLVEHDTQMRELDSRVFIAELPLDQMVPRWLGGVIQPILQRAGRLDMDMRGRIDIDPLDRVVGFDASMWLAGVKDAVTVKGTIDGNQLRLVANSGEVSQPTSLSLTSETLVGDGLSPQAYLPDLHEGQRWTVCTYSLFHPATNPIEIMEARVEKHQPIIWNGATVKAWVVVYETDDGTGMASEPRAKLWVLDNGPHDNGLVIQQELSLFGSKLRFTRLTAERGRGLRNAIEPYSKEEIPAEESKKLLQLIAD
jgi:hypothetical protein